MKRVGGLVLALVATANAGPGRKASPDKFARAAGELFKVAVAAEDAGDLKKAIAMYEKSLEVAVHPNTIFNLAAVYERNGQINDAIVEYEAYLVLAPTASDAVAVRAKITEIEKRPSTLTLTPAPDWNPKDAYVIIDGAIVKRPGDLRGKSSFDTRLGPGSHTIEVFTPVGYRGSTFMPTPGSKWKRTLDVEMPVVGNIGVMADDNVKVGKTADGKGRFALPPGKQAIAVHDGNYECPPITIDAPSNDDVAYVYIKTTEPRGTSRCRKSEIVQRRLTF